MTDGLLDPARLWTGWREFDLAYQPGFVVTIQVNIRRDDVSFWLDNLTVAVIDRNAFREWLIHPREALLRHDVQFVAEFGFIYLAIGASSPRPVPADMVQFFMVAI